MKKNNRNGSMSKLFMYGTSLEGVEQLMVMAPNFQPRISGIVINNYSNYQAGGKNCECKGIYTNKAWNKCGYVGPDLKNNVDSSRYKDLVRECFGKVNNYPLKERLKGLTNNFKGEVFMLI